jgi:Polyketide synthase dehydratase N-terminal domain
VMGLEAMAEAARLPFPGLSVAALEGVDFHAPFKFYRDEPRTVVVRVVWEADGEDVLGRCTVLGTRLLVGRDEPEVTTHFTGTVRLVATVADDVRTRSVPLGEAEVVEAPTIYGTYFHGPAYRVLKDAWRAEGTVAGRFERDLPPNHEPAGRPTLVTPRLVELAFQTAGLAEIATTERMGLPFGFDRLELLRAGDGEVECAAVVHPRDGGAFDVEVADVDGKVLLALEGYRTAALPGPVRGADFAVLRP